MEISAKQLLMAGITTTIDLGAPLQPILGSAIASTPATCRHRAMLVERTVDRAFAPAARGGAMQLGFGGLNISTPQEAGAESR